MAKKQISNCVKNAKQENKCENCGGNAQDLMNKRLWVLSVIHIIFLPLNTITSLLGVNLGGIPGATNHHGFYFLVLILMVVALMIFSVVVYKDWL